MGVRREAWLIKRRHKSERQTPLGVALLDEGEAAQVVAAYQCRVASTYKHTHTPLNIFHQLKHSLASELDGTKNFVPLFGVALLTGWWGEG